MDVSILRVAEITFILCIPVAYWMASKITNVGTMIRSKYLNANIPVIEC